MGQTRRGSYIVPVISRLPILEPEDEDDAVLFEDVTYQPFARTAMLRLAEGLTALRELTHGSSQPTRSRITEAIGAGLSSELCDAVASTLEADSITDLDVGFIWAERLRATSASTGVRLEGGAAPLMRQVSSVLKGEPIVGRQTFVGYVKRLDRGEEDEVGRITLRALDNDKARNITMELNEADYHVAGEANTERRMVSATGILHREPGRALRFTEVTEFTYLRPLRCWTARRTARTKAPTPERPTACPALNRPAQTRRPAAPAAGHDFAPYWSLPRLRSNAPRTRESRSPEEAPGESGLNIRWVWIDRWSGCRKDRPRS
jgi:hypothetical protein